MADTGYTSDRRLYLTADGRVVEADDPARATLLVAAGATLPREVAERYGLFARAAKAASTAPDTKAVSKAPANKSK